MTWQEDKKWSDKFIPEIKRILGEQLITASSYEEDVIHNTDLIVLTLHPLRIACRIRQYKYLENFSDEFTIRASRPSGTETELGKIIEGFGDYLFYGFSNESETAMAKWTIINLSSLRLSIARHMAKNMGELPGKLLTNHDRSSEFLCIPITPDLVLSSGP